eukprot:g9857.t1
MWEHYRFVELLLRKYTIASVAAWDWAVRSLSKLGEWHKGTLFSELCHAGGETNRGRPPMVTTTVLVSRHLVRAMYAAMAKIVGFVIRAQPAQARRTTVKTPAPILLVPSGTSRSLSKDEEALRVKSLVVVGSGEVVWDPGEGVACPAEVEQKDKTPSSTLQRNKKHRSPQYVSGVASTSFLLVVPPRTRTSLFSGFSATSGRSTTKGRSTKLAWPFCTPR